MRKYLKQQFYTFMKCSFANMFGNTCGLLCSVKDLKWDQILLKLRLKLFTTTISIEHLSVLTTFFSNTSVYYFYAYVVGEFRYINKKQVILCRGNNLFNVNYVFVHTISLYYVVHYYGHKSQPSLLSNTVTRITGTVPINIMKLGFSILCQSVKGIDLIKIQFCNKLSKTSTVSTVQMRTISWVIPDVCANSSRRTKPVLPLITVRPALGY